MSKHLANMSKKTVFLPYLKKLPGGELKIMHEEISPEIFMKRNKYVCVVAAPKATNSFTTEELEAMGMVGIYAIGIKESEVK